MRRVFALALLCVLTASPPAFAEFAAGARSGGDGWSVQVSVEPTDLGPISVSLGRVKPARENDAHPWVQHDLVLENTSGRPISFADTRTAAFLGPAGSPVLLAADEGCGYALRPLVPACLMYLQLLTLDPGESSVRPITLFKGLRGLKPLTPGTYVFRKTVRFRAGHAAPEVGARHSVTLRIVYRVEAR